jgi:hypothetical protein
MKISVLPFLFILVSGFLLSCIENSMITDEQQESAALQQPSGKLMAGSGAVQSQTLTFASGTSWNVSDNEGNFLGSAQNVCLNPSTSSRCPSGATLYEYSGVGWRADLSSIPGATWIWAPGITSSTSPAYPAAFIFSKTIELSGEPAVGNIFISADDMAEVYVNRTLVGTVGSTTNEPVAYASQSSLTMFDINAHLQSGSNEISIRAANGNFGCRTGAYRCNPAAVVFGGSIETGSAQAGILVDIKPESFPNRINPSNNGVIPVAILASEDLDVNTIDPSSIAFGPDSAPAAHGSGHLEDVDGDGDEDLMLHFRTRQTGIAKGDVEACITGATYSGEPVEGCDSIETVN